MTNSGDEHDPAARLEHEARMLEEEARRLEEIAHDLEDRAHLLEDEAREIHDAEQPSQHGGERHPDKEHHHHHEDHGHVNHDEKVHITVVVNGESTEIHAKADELLAVVRETALEQTNNVGQPPDKWELKDAQGTLLDVAKTVGSYRFGHKALLFLSLEAGVAGV